MQVFANLESFGTLSYASSIVTLGPSYIIIGAQQYTTGSLTINLTTTGLGGVEATLAAWKMYYIYAVQSAGVVYLIATVTSTGPAGYTDKRLIGYFDTDGTPALISIAKTFSGQVGDVKMAAVTESQFQSVNGPGWILQDGRNVAGSSWATLTGINSVPDARGVHPRGRNNGGSALGARSDGNQDPAGDRAFGNFQGDAFQGHGHRGGVQGGTGSNAALTTVNNTGGYTGDTNYNIDVNSAFLTNGANGTPRTAAETRVKNVPYNFFIKVN